MTEKPKDMLGLLSAPPRTSAKTSAPGSAAAGPKTSARVLSSPVRGESDDASVSVTQLTLRLKSTLEGLGDVAVRGEVSGFKVATGGHWYFDLKDRSAKIPVVVFFKDVRRSPEIPREGDSVVVTGTASFHPAFGKSQLIGKLVLPRGEGALARKLEELKARLGAEGLFDVDRKRRLPTLPATVGVVTSISGAAVRDVLTVIEARAPRTSVIVAPTKVQGDGAAADVAEAIRALDRLGRCQVILVVRGGGAREDLHAFNTEPVVRAIVGCSVPVVSGVGHEIDITLADLAADVRAATPSQAAELAVPRHDDLLRRVGHFENRLRAQARAVVDRDRRRLHELTVRLPSPATLTQPQLRALDRLDARLSAASPQAQLSTRARVLQRWQRRLNQQDPRADIVAAGRDLDAAEARLRDAIRGSVGHASDRLQRALEQLDALSPTAVLRRGWALVTVGDDPTRIAGKDDLVPGQRLRVRVDGGDARVTVDDPENERPR